MNLVRTGWRGHVLINGVAVVVPLVLLGLTQVATALPRQAAVVLSALTDSLTLVLWPAAIGGIGVPHGHLVEARGLFGLLVLANIPWCYFLVWLWKLNRRLRRRAASRA